MAEDVTEGPGFFDFLSQVIAFELELAFQLRDLVEGARIDD